MKNPEIVRPTPQTNLHPLNSKSRFPEIVGTSLGVPITRRIIYWVV